MNKVISKLFIPMLLIYVFFVGVLFINNDYTVSALMPWAPLFYGAMFGLLYWQKKKAFNSVVVVIIYAMWFLRMVITPGIYVLSGYSSTVLTSAGTDNLNFAVLLVIYELFCVTFFLLLNKKVGADSSFVSTENEVALKNTVKTNQYVTLIIFILLLLALFAVWRDRNVTASISSVFSKIGGDVSADVERRREVLRLRNETNLMYHLFFNCVYYLQILIPAGLLAFIKRKNSDSANEKGFLISILIAFAAVLITTDNNSDSVCIMLAAFFVVFFNYRNKTRRYFPYIITAVIAFIAVFLLSKTGYGAEGSDFISDISKLMCAYFASFAHVSAGIAVEFSNKMATFFGDIVSGVPYMMVFFKGYPQSVLLYNEIVYGVGGARNQIMPLIATGYHYLGLLSPAFSIIAYYIAIKAENKMKQSKQILSQVVYAVLVINMSIGPCFWGLSSHIKRLVLFIPLLVLVYINERKKID